jgi:hypothetical protein
MISEIKDKLIGIIVIGLWLLLYTGGTVVGTQQYRDIINQGTDDYFTLLKAWSAVFCFYTLSNVAMLCCLASIIGGICREPRDGRILVLAANGLFIYLILISGLLLLGTNPFENLNQAQYTRLAGTYSLFSFMIGYNPKMLSKLAGKLEELVEK